MRCIYNVLIHSHLVLFEWSDANGPVTYMLMRRFTYKD